MCQYFRTDRQILRRYHPILRKTGWMPFITEIDVPCPLTAFAPLAKLPNACLLYSASGAAGGGRMSYLAIAPYETVTATGSRITHRRFGEARVVDGNPFETVRQIVAEGRLCEGDPVAVDGSIAPDIATRLTTQGFCGGVCGSFGYELARHLERLPDTPRDDMGVPDLAVGIYDVVVAFDHQLSRTFVLSTGMPETVPAARAQRAAARAHEIAAMITENPYTFDDAAQDSVAPSPLLPMWTPDQHMQAVQRTVDYILAGDIFQANISQRFQATLSATFDRFGLFYRLVTANPVSYNAFLNTDDMCLISNSPEQFLQVRPTGDGRRRVNTAPIKGTIARTRGADSCDDDPNFARLRDSAKDKSENVMIVDLLRNDLSKVCTDDSVEVTELYGIEAYPHLYHMVSRITGLLRPGCDAVEALAACFPGGSITGAPKVRAMEVITEMEQTKRGPYCGAIGFISFNGTMDTNISIRTLIMKRDADHWRAWLNVGGGIVADSDPALEYDESLAKAAPFFDALGVALNDFQDPAQKAAP